MGLLPTGFDGAHGRIQVWVIGGLAATGTDRRSSRGQACPRTPYEAANRLGRDTNNQWHRRGAGELFSTHDPEGLTDGPS